MVPSKRKKAEKAKDFKKKKLKVGKTAARADNHTDTSFKSKLISLPNQSLNKKQPKDAKELQEVDLSHHLSLTKHHSNITRREVLAYIEQNLPTNPTMYKSILTLTIPMIHDQSKSTRAALVSLLKKCAEKQPGLLDLHVRSVVLFIHSAMTHIVPDIRNNSSAFLQILLTYAPNSLVKSYFIKTIKSYFNLLSWTLNDDKKAVSLAISTSSEIGGTSKKARITHVAVLKEFLQKSLFTEETEISNIDMITIHPQTSKYLIPQNTPQPYEPLNLFVSTQKPREEDSVKNMKEVDDGSFSIKDLDTLSAEDLDTRRKVMKDVFLEPLLKNLNAFIKEGGELGKESHGCVKLLNKLATLDEDST